MRIHRLNVTDLVAGVLVAAAVTIYAAGEAGAALGGVRARAGAVVLFGILACGTGARRDAFDGNASKPLTVLLNAMGVLTLIAGLTAIAVGSTAYLTALMIGIGLLWIGATIRHLVTDTSTPADAPIQHRELVKR